MPTKFLPPTPTLLVNIAAPLLSTRHWQRHLCWLQINRTSSSSGATAHSGGTGTWRLPSSDIEALSIRWPWSVAYM